MTDRSQVDALVEGINGELRVLAGPGVLVPDVLVIGVLLIATRCGPPT